MKKYDNHSSPLEGPSENGVINYSHSLAALPRVTQTVEATGYKYNSQEIIIISLNGVDDITKLTFTSDENLWINVVGAADSKLIDALFSKLQIDQRIKKHLFKFYPNGLLLLYAESMLMAFQTPSDDDINQNTKVYVILGSRYLVTILSSPLVLLAPLSNHLNIKNSLSRTLGVDYLFSYFISCVIQDFLLPLSIIGKSAEKLETDIMSQPNANMMSIIYDLKKRSSGYYKEIWNLMHLMTGLTRANERLIKKETHAYI